MRGVSRNRLGTPGPAPPETHESLISRKTVAEVQAIIRQTWLRETLSSKYSLRRPRMSQTVRCDRLRSGDSQIVWAATLAAITLAVS